VRAAISLACYWISELALAAELAPFQAAEEAAQQEQEAARLQGRRQRPARPLALPWSLILAATETAEKGQNTAADVVDNVPMAASCLPH